MRFAQHVRVTGKSLVVKFQNVNKKYQFEV